MSKKLQGFVVTQLGCVKESLQTCLFQGRHMLFKFPLDSVIGAVKYTENQVTDFGHEFRQEKHYYIM